MATKINFNMNDLNELKSLIKENTKRLICESHPNVCDLRDSNYIRLEHMIITEILSDKHNEAPSVQTAIATIESEL